MNPAQFRKVQAVKDPRGLEMPAWKKELLGVTDEVQEEESLQLAAVCW